MTKLLIANRGEIACRVARTAQDMGIEVVAVYSDADANAPHVLMADEAILLGGGPVAESYLNIDKVIDAINTSGADLVHPGYGFLSENPEFRDAIDTRTKATFVGPSTHAIKAMGDKAAAKQLMQEAGVPLIPGYDGEDQTDERLIEEAEKIGFPLMVKAAAGGGGRGIRKVYQSADLPGAIESARSESLRAFSSDILLLEKLVEGAAHVEIQILSDGKTTWHLGERDCSLQRRHQKVVEEAPSPRVQPDLRQRMGASAIKAAETVSYEGAGTVEFLLDDDGNYYFLEMNTRLQVEHPVTEEITGLDLVELQLRIALGEILDLPGEPQLEGHSIEVRLYAEDPFNGFTPEIGKILRFEADETSTLRIDAGVDSGSVISPYYDPMIAKLITYGATREEARLAMIEALDSFHLIGVRTNRAYLQRLLALDKFIDGTATTGLLDDLSENLTAIDEDQQELLLALSAAGITAAGIAEGDRARGVANSALNGFSTGLPLTYPVMFDDARVDVDILDDTSFRCTHGENTHIFTLGPDDTAEVNDISYPFETISIDGIQHTMWGAHYLTKPLRQLRAVGDAAEAGEDAVIAPSHATVRKVSAAVGATISKGDPMVTIEAMKMETVLKAPRDGIIQSVSVAEGEEIRKGSVLVMLHKESE